MSFANGAPTLKTLRARSSLSSTRIGHLAPSPCAYSTLMGARFILSARATSKNSPRDDGGDGIGRCGPPLGSQRDSPRRSSSVYKRSADDVGGSVIPLRERRAEGVSGGLPLGSSRQTRRSPHLTKRIIRAQN